MTLLQFLDAAARFRVPVDWTMIQLQREGRIGYCTLAEVIRYAHQQLEHCPEKLLPQVLTLADSREMDWALLEETLRWLASDDPLDREHAARRCRVVMLETLLEKSESQTGPLDDDGLCSYYCAFDEFWREFAEVPGGMDTSLLQSVWDSADHRANVISMVRVQREWLARERAALGLPAISVDAEPHGCATS